MDAEGEFIEAVRRPEDDVSLERLSLLVAANARPQLEIDMYLREIDRIAARVNPGDLESLRQVLFSEEGFRGNTTDYYDADNSMLDMVLTRRVGIPITLSVLTIAVARRAGIGLVGIGMPGHFLVRSASDLDVFLDPFGGGLVLRETECEHLFHQSQGSDARFGSGYLAPVGTFAIVERMLNNLLSIHRSRADTRSQLWVARLRAELPQATVLQRADVAIALASGGHFDTSAELFEHLAQGADPSTANTLRAARDRMRSLMN